MFPWLGKWFSSIKVVKNTVQSQEQIRKMTKRLKDTLVPQVCRGFVDAFLIRQQTLEVCRLVLQLFSKIVNVFTIYNVFNKNTTVSFCVSSFHGTNIFFPSTLFSCDELLPLFFHMQESGSNTYYTSENLYVSIANLFNAGTDTTATTLRWGLLLMAKYPKIQGKEVTI